jgi:hypothetical protein
MALTLMAGIPASAQTVDEHDAHHPPGAIAAPQAPDSSAPAQPGMMMNRMMGGRNMMGMMGMMNMMRGGAGPMMMGRGMGMIDYIEGRIAFLKAELKITDAQTPAWNAFAEALRANARRLGEVRSAMMTRESTDTPQTVIERLELEERWLTSRLDGARATRSSLTALYGVLSAEQKKAADDLIAPYVGVLPAMMRMAAAIP